MFLSSHTAAPVSPTNSSYNVSSHGLQNTSIIVQWSYPEDGPGVDQYTITVTSDALATPLVLATNEMQVPLSNVLYNTVYTVGITASNCVGTGTAASFNIAEGM